MLPLRIRFIRSLILLCVGACLSVAGPWHGTADAQASIPTPVTVTAFKYVNCSSSQLQKLTTASAHALRLLQTSRSQAHFIRWFGDSRADPALWAAVHQLQEYGRWYAIEALVHFSTAARAGILPQPYTRILSDNITFDCAGGRQDVVAHVTGPDTGKVYLDFPFWTLNETRMADQRISMASTILHELSHLAGTTDYRAEDYGWPASQHFEFALALAAWLPSWAVWNANNHEWYYYGL